MAKEEEGEGRQGGKCRKWLMNSDVREKVERGCRKGGGLRTRELGDWTFEGALLN